MGMAGSAALAARADRAVRCCAIYVRISQDRGGGGLGVQRQEEDCRALAEARGWQVYAVYADNDTSAYRNRKRKQWTRMLADARAGKFQAIIAWHPDRLTRIPRENEDFIDLVEELDLETPTVSGDFDLSTTSGRTMFRMFGVMARQEVEHKGDKHRRANIQAAESGKPFKQGWRCFGYKQDGMTLIEDEVTLALEAADRVLRGQSIRSIVIDWRNRGVLNVTGKPFSRHTLQRMLLNPRMAGKRTYKGRIVGDGIWPPIFTESQHRKLEAILNNPARRLTPSSGSMRRYLLSSRLLRCGRPIDTKHDGEPVLCFKPMVSGPNNSGNPSYRCRPGPPDYGCGGVRITAEGLEQDITEQVIGMLATPGARRALLSAAQGSADGDQLLLDEITELQRRQNELGEQYATADREQLPFLKSANDAVTKRLAEVREQLHHATQLGKLPAASTPEALWEWWENADLAQRHDLVEALIERVVILPVIQFGRRSYDGRRVEIHWRGGAVTRGSDPQVDTPARTKGTNSGADAGLDAVDASGTSEKSGR